MEFDAPNEKSGFNSGTLTLKFKKADEIWAGCPYIVRWGTPDSPAGGVIENPVFPAVRIEEFKNIDPYQCGNICWDRSVRFYGTFKPVNIYHETTYYTLYLGAENKLYYPTNDSFNINAFRAYFELGKGYFFGTSTSNVKEIVLNYGDENTTKISWLSEESDKSDNWYSLDGIRMSKKPSTKGIYIHNGRKVVIK